MSQCAFDPVADTILTDGVWNEPFDVQDEDAGGPEAIPVGTVITVSLKLRPGPGQAAEAPIINSTTGGGVVITSYVNGQFQMAADPSGYTPGKYDIEVLYLVPGASLPEPLYRGVRNVVKGGSQ